MSDPVRAAAIALYDRFTHDGMDRRAFMAELSRIAGGTAAASLLLSAIAAQAREPKVAADHPGLLAHDIQWPVAKDRILKGYSAMPRPVAERPLVLVIHENRGLNDHIRDVTRRLALAGYSALAPDLLTPDGGTPADEDEARRMISALDVGSAAIDLVATIGWFRNPDALRRRRVGAIGFCWGGAMVNRLAIAAEDALDAGVSFYGPAPELTEAAKVEAAMLIHLAGLDERVNRTGIPWGEALKAVGPRHEVILHQGVNHAFHNDTSAERYDAAAASRAWAATLAFFERHLRG